MTIAQKLQAIDDALARIEEGTYGVCEGCDSEIAPARLEVLPFTQHIRRQQDASLVILVLAEFLVALRTEPPSLLRGVGGVAGDRSYCRVRFRERGMMRWWLP